MLDLHKKKAQPIASSCSSFLNLRPSFVNLTLSLTYLMIDLHSASSDLELWDAIKNDDIKAFNCFFDRHWERVFTAVFYVTTDREICSEVTNDIFLNLWVKRKELSITFFKSYLTTAAYYHVYRYVKSSKKDWVSLDDFTVNPGHFAVNNQAEDTICYNELMEHITNDLKVLPKRCKEIFNLSRKEHLTNDEIAERLAISKRTVENQLSRALHYIRISFKSFVLIIPAFLNIIF